MSRRTRRAPGALFVPLLLVAALGWSCSLGSEQQAAVCALMDVSGTYADQQGEVTRTLKAGVLSQMLPGDSLFVLVIDSDSYEQGNVVATLRTDPRPLAANAQKLALARELDAFAESRESSQYTDISGAMLLCGDYLESSPAGTRVMLVFSDMREELPAGVSRVFESADLDGVHVAAVHVIKLRKDNVEPARYRSRLAEWQARMEAAGAASWTVILDPARVPEYLERLR